MAEKWQRWMPFHIDKFRGSPEVQAMHPAARMGYLYLLASCWQTADCTLSSDPVDLATESGLGDDMWAVYGPRIVRKFELHEGRLRNEVLYADWTETKTSYEARCVRAKKVAETKRTPHRDEVDSTSRRSGDTKTLTKTLTTTSAKNKQKTSADAAHISDQRHEGCKAAVMAYGAFKRVQLAWDGSEGKQLAALLKSAPALTLMEFQACLTHRARSPGTPHGERPRIWLPHILKYQQGPLNEFNRTEEVDANKLGNRKADSANTALQRAQERVIAAARRDEQAGLLLPGSGGGDGRDTPGKLLESPG